MKVTVISSSVRQGRLSHRLTLALLGQIAAKGHTAFCIDLKEANFPLFDGRLGELAEQPLALLKCSETLSISQGIIVVTPEYNGGIPAALKNLFDVLGKSEFSGKPMGVASVSTGIMGGVRAAYQLQQIILALQAYPQPQMLLAAEVQKQVDENGAMVNPVFQQKVNTFLNSFLSFAEKMARPA